MPALPLILNLAPAGVPAARAASASTASDPCSLAGTNRGPERRSSPAACGATFSSKRGHPVEGADVEVERDRAARRPRADIDVALGRDARSAEIGNGEPLDFERLGVETQIDVGTLDGDAGDRRSGDIERQRAFLRPFQRRAGRGTGEHVLHQPVGAVEIDLRRAERRLDPRGMIGARPRIGETPFEGHAIELRLEAVDGDGLGAEPDIALGAEWPRNRLGVAATGEPGDERARVPRLDPRRAGEVQRPAA